MKFLLDKLYRVTPKVSKIMSQQEAPNNKISTKFFGDQIVNFEHLKYIALRLKFQENSPSQALRIVENYLLSHRDSKESWKLYGQLLYSVDRKLEAQAVLEKVNQLDYEAEKISNVVNLITAKFSGTVAYVDDDKKLLYVNIPKCASSTIKNYFSAVTTGKQYGEQVHFNFKSKDRVIKFSELDEKYKDYYKFTVVRDPISRLVSYYTKNIKEGSLRREALGEISVGSLSTKPGPRQIYQYFFDYRKYFLDFKHHTDSIDGYLGGHISKFNRIYKISELSEVRQLIEDKYSVSIEKNSDSMKSKQENMGDKELACEVFSQLKFFYDKDYRMYKDYF